MTPEIAARLVALNRRFYEECGGSFSETRLRLQPGVARCLAQVPPEASLLDLGCGNGNALAALARRNHQGPMFGVDSSQALLEQARRLLPGGAQAAFLHADLADDDWEACLPQRPFDFIVAFAVFHHLPGSDLRLRVAQAAARRLAPGGRFIHSHWQFQNSARLLARVQPWESAGIEPGLLEPGDTLLDWRRGAGGLRYVHLSTPQELAEMAQAAGFDVRESFYSDGQGGNLGLYQIWEYNRE